MIKNYLKVKEKLINMSSNLSKAIVYVVCRDGKKNGVSYKSIEERFERFERDTIKSSLESLTSQSPPLIVFDEKRQVYRPSEHLERLFTRLNLIK